MEISVFSSALWFSGGFLSAIVSLIFNCEVKSAAVFASALRCVIRGCRVMSLTDPLTESVSDNPTIAAGETLSLSHVLFTLLWEPCL